MNSCLGIYLDDKIVKYAKLEIDSKNKSVQVLVCGVKQIIGEKTEIIKSIIQETGSQNVPIAMNVPDVKYKKIETIKQLNKNDLQSILDLEVFEFATEFDVHEKLLTYKYMDLYSERPTDNNHAIIAITEKSKIEQYLNNKDLNVQGIYPTNFVMDKIIEKTEPNYICINLGEDTEMITVTNGKVSDISNLSIGMEDVLNKLTTYLGSISKAYEICKTINIFSDTTNSNDPEIEKIIEPILQDILHRVEEKIKENKKDVNKIFLCGIGTLFTNIDMLFEEYFNLSSSILKPNFLEGDNWDNISDIVETNEAIAIAKEFLTPGIELINFADIKNVKAVKKDKMSLKFNFKNIKLSPEKLKEFVNLFLYLFITIIVTYLLFGMIYNKITSSLENKVILGINELKEENEKMQEDIDYITLNTKKYSDINSFIEETIRKIEGNEIGKYSTYNVANFMQNISKYVPQNVVIMTISSDDNKKIEMTVRSGSYADLGYFVSQIKLKQILMDVEVETIEHSGQVQIKIGGDLP